MISNGMSFVLIALLCETCIDDLFPSNNNVVFQLS